MKLIAHLVLSCIADSITLEGNKETTLRTTNPGPLSSLLIVLCLSIGPTISNGFARFAYALLLPSMRDSFSWSYSTAGLLNTSNAIGYLVGAIAVFLFVSKLGNRRLFCVGLLVTSLSMIATGLTSSFTWLMIWRLISGGFGAAIFICGSALAGSQFYLHTKVQALAIPLYFGGAGIGMVLSGVGIPFMFVHFGPDAWPEAWIAMGCLSILLSLVSILAALRCTDPSSLQSAATWNARKFITGITAYLIYGCGYITYMTFVIAWMKINDATPLEIGLFWGLLGFSVMASPYVWKSQLALNSGGNTLGKCCAVLAFATALLYVNTSLPMLLCSSFLFGSSMFIGPAAITVMVKNGSSRETWGAGIAGFTIAFGLGQAVGPIVSGWIGDLTGSLKLSLLISSGILGAAAVIAFFQKDIRITS